MPINIPSQNRARAFLWLVYHYLEDPTSSKADAPSTNPFADEYSSKNPGKVPWLPRLSTEDMQSRGENIDPKEEIDWGSKMCALRTTFLQRLVKTSEVEKKNRSEFTSSDGMPIFVLLYRFTFYVLMYHLLLVLELVPAIRKQRAHRQTYLSEDQESGFRHYAPQASPGCESVPSTSRSLSLLLSFFRTNLISLELSPSLPHVPVNNSLKRPQLRTRRMLDRKLPNVISYHNRYQRWSEQMPFVSLPQPTPWLVQMRSLTRISGRIMVRSVFLLYLCQMIISITPDQRLCVLKRLRGKSPTPPSHVRHLPEERRDLSRARWHPYARIKRRHYNSNGQFYDVTAWL